VPVVEFARHFVDRARLDRTTPLDRVPALMAALRERWGDRARLRDG
jgi:hypothetical protein